MTDRDFEQLLEEQITALPPGDDLVAHITPWRQAMNRILAGLTLVTITLNFWNLNTILPALGHILMLLGLRTLRQENRWFTVGFGLSILRAAWMAASIFFNSTIFSPDLAILQYLNILLDFAFLLCLRCGIRAVQIKAGMEARVASANWLLVFYCIMVFLALQNYTGILGWILVAVYVLVIRGLVRLSRALDDSGYAISAAPVRFSDRTVKIACAAAIALAMAVGYLFFSQYPMDWSEQKETSAEAEEIKDTLLALGFPADVLNDLADEDLLNCVDAAAVISDTEIYNISRTGGEPLSYTITGPDGLPETHTEFIARELRMTHAAVQLDRERDTWVIFHHFRWLEEPDFRGTEALQIWPTSRLDGWSQASGYTGRVLCEMDGTTHTAPYYSLGAVTGTSTSVFWENQISTDGIAVFSLPRDAENGRGYVSYTIKVAMPGYIIDSWCNYYYRTAFPAFPNRGSADAVPIGMASNSDTFKMIVSALQMGPKSKDDLQYDIFD